jgi:acyl-CoA dehydrogenase
MDMTLSDEQQLLKKTVREFAEAELGPHSREWDEKQEFPREVFAKLAELGLMGVTWPAEYGGSELSTLDWCLVLEELSRLDAGVALSVAAHNSLCSGHIFLAGSEEQKKTYLSPLARGEKLGCWGLTENSAGSDAGGTKTKAVRDGAHWVLNGSKTFITNGQHANLIIVVAKTDPKAGAKGTSLFAVEADDAQGFRRGRKLKKLGMDSADTSELFFEDVQLPASSLLGTEEGQGFYQLMKELPQERLIVAVHAVAMMERALALTIDYVKQRKAFGQAIIEFQNTQFELAECKTETTIARVFLDHCIERHVKGELDTVTASMAKYRLTDTQGKVIDRCLQLFGGYGYMDEYPISRMYRDARVLRIYAGTNEIMKLLIARSL